MESRYHNCRWCKYRSGDTCLMSSEVFESGVADALYDLAESGKLSEAIEEGIKIPKLDTLNSILAGYGLSQKRQKEILQAVGAELEGFIPSMVESIDSTVSKLIINLDPVVQDLYLKDPESFYCKHFD